MRTRNECARWREIVTGACMRPGVKRGARTHLLVHADHDARVLGAARDGGKHRGRGAAQAAAGRRFERREGVVAREGRVVCTAHDDGLVRLQTRAAGPGGRRSKVEQPRRRGPGAAAAQELGGEARRCRGAVAAVRLKRGGSEKGAANTRSNAWKERGGNK